MSLLTHLEEQRSLLQVRLDELAAAPDTEGRATPDLTDEEKAEFTDAIDKIKALDARLAEVREAEELRVKAGEKVEELGVGETRDNADGSRPVRVVSEEATYHRGNKHEANYLQDVCRAAIGGPLADSKVIERLARHGREMEDHFSSRAGLTTVNGAGGTFVPPIYLVEDFVALARPGRPFASACTMMELPRGTDSINLPRVATGTAVAVQGTQNTAVTETDLTDAYVSSPVATLAGQQTVSLQLIEQSPIAFDDVVLGDLTRALGVGVDVQTISGSGTGGNLTGALNAGQATVTYTSASPTQAAMLPFIQQAVGQIHATRFAPPTHIWMTPQRWAWFLSGVDSNNRPFVVPDVQGPFNSAAVLETVAAEGRIGTLGGLPVYVDASIPRNLGAGTNQDVIIVAKQDDFFLWEGTLTTRALPQTLGNQLSVLLQVYEYLAFIANRYTSSAAVLSGTGMVVQAGY